MTLATSFAGQVHAATLFYANDGLELVFVSDTTSAHARAILADPRVALTISQDYADWQAIQGAQVRGEARLLEDDRRASQVYLARFPFVAAFPQTFRYWQISPTWLRLIDNTRGFAHKDELTL